MKRTKLTFNVGKKDPNPMITDRNGCSLSLEKYCSEFSSKFSPLSREKELELLAQAQHGDKDAEREIFNAFARFVISIAKKMHSSYRTDTRVASVNDFVQWGNIGLLRAIEKYSLSSRHRFISYAVNWITGVMMSSYGTVGTMIHIPQNRKASLNKYRREENASADPLIETFFGNDGVLFSTAYDELYKLDKAALKIPRQYHALDDLLKTSTSTNDELSSIETKTDAILMVDMKIDQKLLLESFFCEVARSLWTLTPAQAAILIFFFGIQPLYVNKINSWSDEEKKRYVLDNFPEGMTIKYIGEMYGLTRERVRQIKNKALQRLRHNSRSVLLRPYFELFY